MLKLVVHLSSSFALLFLLNGVATAAEPVQLSAEEQKLGFQLLFDGATFDGWKQSGNWKIEEGVLYRAAKGGDITYTAAKVPDEFEVRFDWKVAKGCNSGVYYRSNFSNFYIF